jgi:hypothetical protein
MSKDAFENLSAFLENQHKDIDEDRIKSCFLSIMESIKRSESKREEVIGKMWRDGYRYNEEGFSILGVAAIYAKPYQFFSILKFLDKEYIKAFKDGRHPIIAGAILNDTEEDKVLKKIDTSLAKLLIDHNRVDIIEYSHKFTDPFLGFRVLYRKLLLELNSVDYSLEYKTRTLPFMERLLGCPTPLEKEIYKRCKMAISNFVEITKSTMGLMALRASEIPDMPSLASAPTVTASARDLFVGPSLSGI